MIYSDDAIFIGVFENGKPTQNGARFDENGTLIQSL